MSRLNRSFLTIFTSVALTIAGNAAVQDQANQWAESNYTAVLDSLLPNRAVESSRLAKNTKWLLSGRILPPHEGHEFGFSLQRDYGGQVELSVIRPKGASLISQLRALKKEFPDASLDRISGLVLLDHRKMTLSNHPQLRRLADQFEEIRMSPLSPDELHMDGTGYQFWIETHWGSRTSVLLSGPGSQASKQQHPLLAWAEALRALVETSPRN